MLDKCNMCESLFCTRFDFIGSQECLEVGDLFTLVRLVVIIIAIVIVIVIVVVVIIIIVIITIRRGASCPRRWCCRLLL